MVDGKVSSIMFHWYSIHAPHMWDSGLVLVVTGEVEVSVKALVGSTSMSSGMTCRERRITVYLQQKFNVVGFALMYVIQTIHTHTPMHINVDTWTQCNTSTVCSQLLDLVVHCPLCISCD